MNQTEVLEQINVIFKRVLENESITILMETTADDVEEWTSLNYTVLISEVEIHFKIKFKLREFLEFKKVGDLVQTIVKKLE